MAIELTKAAKNIASNLTSIRQNKNFSQAQLSKVSGVKRASIALLESGTSNPTLEILLKLSHGLRVSIDELISSPRVDCKLIKASEVPLDRRSKNGVALRKLLPEKIPATEVNLPGASPGASQAPEELTTSWI